VTRDSPGASNRTGPERRLSTATGGFWSLSLDDLFRQLGSTPGGLTGDEAARRLREHGPNRLRTSESTGTLRLLLVQFGSPITVLLAAAATLSLFLGETTDGLTILGIVLASGLMGFWQERGAAGAVRRLMAMVQTRATVLRDGEHVDVPLEDVVPGDVASLVAGDAVPGDGRLLDGRDLHVDEATLTGESFPAEKMPGEAAAAAGIADRRNCVFLGTHVVSGTAQVLVVTTGRGTEFGAIAERLRRRPPESDFERGIRRFGYFLLQLTLVLVLFILVVNVSLGRGVLETLLFSLALAVGLTPQLLPAIVSVTLAHGARRLAQRQVIVKRLASIENFGSMTILCSDKTGTITEGVTRIDAALDASGARCDRVLEYAQLNALLQSGFPNPIDHALREAAPPGLAQRVRKLDEIPYDFVRKRLSVAILEGTGKDDAGLLITKGSVPTVLDVCTRAELADGTTLDMPVARVRLNALYERLSAEGARCLGVACRRLPAGGAVNSSVEADMTFLGVVALADPIKADAARELDRLRRLGITLKLVTGDNRHVAAHVAGQVGLRPRVITGAHLHRLSDAALVRLSGLADVFAEVEPNQKERIILALKQGGASVGFLGDGINDASALHAADVGISVDTAMDVTRQAADIVLLKKDLGVLADGVGEGRRAFGNTLKYIFITISANFGNMFSMAGASLFATFLPLLPEQILLINVLTDLPAMAIATDRLDPEMVDRPRRWDIHFIRDFMITFGLVSSTFDFVTFGALLVMKAPMAEFRTAWFLESVLSEILVLLIIRTRRPFFRSRPSRPLLVASIAVGLGTLVLAFLPIAGVFGLEPVSGRLLAVLGGIVLAYVLVSEASKRVFYRVVKG
jgi:P-type Mg2+ transporter